MESTDGRRWETGKKTNTNYGIGKTELTDISTEIVGSSSATVRDEDKDELGQIDNIIGNFGRYQFIIFLFKILIGVQSSFANLGVTFFAPSGFIAFECATWSAAPGQQQSSIISANTNHSTIGLNGIEIDKIFKDFIVGDERSIRHNSFNFSYETPKNLMKNCTYLNHQKCTSYHYNTGIWISTIIDEWDLVCDRAWLVSFIQSLYMSGFLVSFLMFGYLSDRFGRWRSLMLGAVIEIISGFGCALSTSVTMFMIFRFMLGLGNAGRSSSSYLHLVEWIGPKWRMPVSIISSLGWIVGYCLVPWVSLYFLHFRHVQLFVCFYEIIFIIWLLFLPESPRWLLTHKRFDETYQVLLKAAKFNGLIRDNNPKDKNKKQQVKNKQFDGLSSSSAEPGATHELINLNKFVLDDSSNSVSAVINNTTITSGESIPLKPYTIDEYNVRFRRLVQAVENKNFTRTENKLNFIDLFKWKNLRKYTLILCFICGANSFIYYGIALGVGDFGGDNLFVAFTLAGLTELPSMIFAIVCMKFLPRKTANIFIFLATGLMCSCQLPLKYFNNIQWLQQTTMMIAKLLNSCSFEVIRYLILELFPTTIRHNAYGATSLAARIGSILAPFIKELAQITNTYVPPAIFASLCFIEALLIRGVPETKGSDMPDTLMDAENFKGVKKRVRVRKEVSSDSN